MTIKTREHKMFASFFIIFYFFLEVIDRKWFGSGSYRRLSSMGNEPYEPEY